MWGVAYEIAKEDEEMVTVQLDHREKDGYNKQLVTFCPANNILTDCENNKPSKISCLVFFFRKCGNKCVFV